MARQPYFPLYSGDWLSDPRVSMLTAAARGIWIDVVSALHRSDSCTLTGTSDQLARVLRCLESDLQPAFNLFQTARLADIKQRDANGLNIITIIGLDAKAVIDERNRKAANQKNYRERQRNGNVPVTVLSGVISKNTNVTGLNFNPDNDVGEVLPERYQEVSRSSYSYSTSEEGGGKATPARGRAGEPDSATSATVEIVLTEAETKMSQAVFLTAMRQEFAYLENFDNAVAKCREWFKTNRRAAPNKLDLKRWLATEYGKLNLEGIGETPAAKPAWTDAERLIAQKYGGVPNGA